MCKANEISHGEGVKLRKSVMVNGKTKEISHGEGVKLRKSVMVNV